MVGSAAAAQVRQTTYLMNENKTNEREKVREREGSKHEKM
jgi:hypothetical protein